MLSNDKNRLGKTWKEYDQEISFALKNYLLINVSKSQYKITKSMWKRGYDVSDIISYIILSAK